MRAQVICCWAIVAVIGCGSEKGGVEAAPPRIDWAIAAHGGAGVIPRSMAEDLKGEYLASLGAALTVGRDALAAGSTSLGAVEAVVRFLEDDPKFNAGKGAVFNYGGDHEMDAAIMDGRTLACGAVAGVRTVKNPISLARLVMERSQHVLFAGAGAEAFADLMGVERVDADYFFVQRRWDQWHEALGTAVATHSAAGIQADDGARGTVGAVALDRAGNLAAATSTGGLTGKLYGRIGDTPIIGAGTFASNASCAVSATGKGEEFIRRNVAHDIAALTEYRELSVAEAAETVVHGKLAPGDGGVIAVGRDGATAMVFNTEGMYRGAADSSGRFEVRIW